ncbi:MAG: hypothetical protein DSY90_13070 [Deltaproteobacteria bacterium]|nr:MAG: hypothetical protein DSY90_13070 [Deltaproteobacteria bacterium]RUA03634.1 MAG: hypothetical protein DSY89_00330 [Deltaproteobacteria bacterium]
MWNFIILFFITLSVYILFFISMLFRKTQDDSTSSGGHCGSHQCQCSGGQVNIQEKVIGPMTIKKEGDGWVN